MTIKDLAEMSVNHGLVCQKYVTPFLREIRFSHFMQRFSCQSSNYNLSPRPSGPLRGTTRPSPRSQPPALWHYLRRRSLAGAILSLGGRTLHCC